MKVYTLLPSLYLVASVFTANAQQPSIINSNDSGLNIIPKNNGGPSSVRAMAETNTMEQPKVGGLPLRADADVKTTTVTVTTTRTTTTNNDGGFGFFGSPKTVTTTVLSTLSAVDKTATVTVTAATGGTTTITVAASTTTQKATITVTEKGDTITTTLPASTVTVSSLPTTASTRARGLFDGLFPAAEDSTQSKSTSTTAKIAISSSTSTGNKLLGDISSGLFGGRTIALPEKCATQTEYITTTVTKPFELFPKETGFKFSFPPISLPTGKPSFPGFSFPTTDPKTSGLPGLPALPSFPDLKFPNLSDPTEILNTIENIIKVIELVEPRNPILGFIKNIVQEAKKLGSNQDKEQSIFSIITQALKSLSQPSAPPLPGLFPFIQSSGDDNSVVSGKQQGLDLEEFLKLLLSDNIEIQKKLQK